MPLNAFDAWFQPAHFEQMAQDAAHRVFGDITSRILLERTVCRLLLDRETAYNRRGFFSMEAPRAAVPFTVPTTVRFLRTDVN